MHTRVLRKNADVAWMRSHATTILGQFPFLPEELESLTAWLQAYAAKATLDYRCNGSYHRVEIANGQIISHTEELDGREDPFLSFTFLPDTELLGECSPSVRGAVEKAMFLFF